MFKKLLILTVAGLIYLHFYPEPAVDAWYENQKSSLQKLIDNTTGTEVRLKTDVIYKDLLPELSSFSLKEQSYLKEVTLTRHSVKIFYKNYCISGVQGPIFNRINQIKVCKTINRYSDLL